MMSAIRTAASNWLGRVVLTVIMGLLVVSFAIWGIGDIFRGGATRNVATVGSAVISADDYRNAFNTELRNLQQRTRRPLSTADVRAFGLDREILNRMIDDAALIAKAGRLGLALDDTVIAKSILEADAFRTNGQFDRDRYLGLLQQSGLSEPVFRRQQADFLLRQQLVSGLVGGLESPRAFAEALHQYRDEERSLQVVAIPAGRVPDPVVPDDAALRAFHTERKSEFRTVEARKATVLAVAPAMFAASLTFFEADLRAFYDRALAAGRYGTPEKRRALRILFDTEADAKVAADKLGGGATFETILAERKLTEADVDLGLRSRTELTDVSVRDAVFALPSVGAVSPPIRDPFGYVLIRLQAIEPAVATPFEQARVQIEAEARADKLRNDPDIRKQVDDFVRKIDDQKIAGKSLAETAQITGLSVLEFDGLDREGKGPDGKPIPVPGAKETVDAIFSSDIGLDNEALHLRDGSHVWYEVNGVSPARDKAFEEVQAEVRDRYLTDRKSKAVGDFAQSLLKRLEAGESIGILATELGAELQIFSGVKRNARDPVLGQAGVDRGFASEIGKPVSAIAPDGIGRFLIVPSATSLLPFDAASFAASGLPGQLAQGFADDLFRQYVAAIRKQAGVAINEATVNQALGQAN
ncbi:SurA Parvulin-like peptidyl-prolyl isomerase [Rhabdaerophilaceae bacterium]